MKRAAAAVLLFVAVLALAVPAAQPLAVAQFTDIHYGNELYDAAAWDRAYEQCASLHPDVVLLTGDQVDNKCAAAEFGKRQQQFLGTLGPRLRQLACPVMLALGNNDFVENYQTRSSQVADTVREYRASLGDLCYLDDLGNGAYPREVAGMTWLSINSVIFSPHNHAAERDAQADATFRWLGAHLRSLPRGRPVVLLSHIPPTADLFDNSLAWRPAYLQRLVETLSGYDGSVMIVAAHFHRNEIHALPVPGHPPVPVLIAGSLSFKYGNYPNWRSYRWLLSAQGTLSDLSYRLRYPGNAEWDRDWALSQPMRQRSYQDLALRMQAEADTYRRYMEDLYAHNEKWTNWAQDPVIKGAMLQEMVEPDKRPKLTIPH